MEKQIKTAVFQVPQKEYQIKEMAQQTSAQATMAAVVLQDIDTNYSKAQTTINTKNKKRKINKLIIQTTMPIQTVTALEA